MRTILIFLAVLFFTAIGNLSFGQGNTCDDPIVITSLPFDMNNFDACGYGNDYSNPDVPCGGSHMNGDEIVFSYTSTSNEDLFMSYQVSGTWDSGIFVMDGCPFSSANCVYVATDPDLDNDIQVCDLSLNAGQTYYFIFSFDDDDDWYHCNDYTYDFHLELIDPMATPTVQDCLGAIPVCQDQYQETDSYVGTGNVHCEVNNSTTCIDWGALNYVWYTFTVQTSGQLSFDITPNNSNDDYDWVLYDLNNYTCEELYDAPTSDLKCNFDGLDNTNNPNSLTGMCSGCNDNNGYENSINVTVGQTFALMVNNFSSSQHGYLLDFAASTAVIYDNTPPEFESVEAIFCGDGQLTFTMSENVLCNTADVSSITLTGPGGPYTLTNIYNPNCAAGGEYGDVFTVDVSPALTTSGNFTLDLSGTFSDFCGNVAVPSSFDFTIENIILTTTIIDINDCNTLCDGSISVDNATGGTAPYTYSWSHDGGLSSSTAPNLCEDTYTVTVSDVAGCSAVFETPIVIVANCGPSITLAANPITICEGESSVLTQTSTNGTPGYTYVWDNALTGTGPHTVSPTTTTTYHVTVTDSNGDTDDAQITITVNPANSVLASTSVAAICPPEIASLTAVGSGGDGSYTFDWSPASSLDDATDNANPVASPSTLNTSVTYIVTLTDGNGCTSTNTVDVYIGCNPEPVLSSSNIEICEGESTTIDISVSGGLTPYVTPYTWDNGLTGTVSQTVSPTSTTTYCVTVTDANGATGTDCITITVNPANSVTATTSITVICPPETASLTAVGSGGDGNFTYDWSPAATLDDASDNANPVADPNTINTNFTYTVTLTDGNGCTSTNSVDVYVSCNPEPTLTSSSSEICLGESATIDIAVAGGLTPYVNPYTWDNGLTGAGSQIVSPTVTTTYCVTVTDANGATGNDCVTIVVNPVPVASAGADVTICEGESTILSASGGTSYDWSIPASGQTQTVSPTNTTIYTVTVTDNTAAQCSSTSDVTVTVNPIPVANVGADIDICLGESASITASGGSSYLWNTNETTANINVSPTQATTYTVTVSDLGCSSTDEMNVIIHGVPSIDAGLDQDVCSGDDATLLAIGSGSFVWSDGLGNSQQVVASPSSTTTYFVTLTDTYGCTASDNVTVNVYSVQNIQVTPDDAAICNGDAVTFTASGVDSYQWYPATGLSSSVGASVLANPTVSTEYTVTGIYGPGCMVSASVMVNVDNVVVEISGPANACIGDEITLSSAVTDGVDPYTYLWTETGETSSEITTVVKETQLFTVNVVDNLNCTATATINVHVYDSLHIQVNSNTDYVCPGDTILTSASIYGGTGSPYTLSLDGDYIQSINKIRVLEDHDYIFVVSDGCMSVTDTLRLNTYTLPSVDFIANKYALCEGESVKFNSIVQPSNLVKSYFWNFGSNDNNNLSFSENPEHVFDNQGLNDVSLRVITIDGCVIDSLKRKYIRVDPRPSTNFKVEPEITSILKPEVYLNNLTEGADSFYWNFGNNNDESNIENPLYKYNSVGNYEIMLVATTQFGCKDTVYRFVRIEPEIRLWMPTAFTPDRDGLNDTFGPKGTNIIDKAYQMLVYDRWGEKIFESKELDLGWDGKAKNGDYVSPGVYPYYIKYKDIYNISHEISGVVNVIW